MNLASVFAAHKAGVVAGGGAAAVGVALYARSKKGSSSSGAASRIIQPATLDSTSNDLYNSIEPLIENQDNQIASFATQLQNALAALNPANQPTPTPTPAENPAPPPAPAPPVTAPTPAPIPVAAIPAPAASVPPPSSVPAINNYLASTAPTAPQITLVPTGPGSAYVNVATPGQPAFSYGGATTQANQIVAAQTGAPAPASDPAPASWGGQGGWDDKRYSW